MSYLVTTGTVGWVFLRDSVEIYCYDYPLLLWLPALLMGTDCAFLFF